MALNLNFLVVKLNFIIMEYQTNIIIITLLMLRLQDQIIG
jgi:hypothetical protein